MSHYKPYPAYKDSGVDWIGRVPNHWNEFRVATLFEEANRGGSAELPILSISIHDGITDKELNPEDRDRQTYQIEDRTKYKRVLPGDIAYNMMRAWQGAFGAVRVEGLVSPAYVVAQPKRDFRTSYVELLLRTPMAIEEMRRFSRGIADFRMRLYWEYFKDIRVCLPPRNEQDAIVDCLSRETRRIDALIQKKTRFLELLKEKVLAVAMNEQINGSGGFVRLRHLVDVVSRPVKIASGDEYVALGLYNRGRGLFHKPPTLGKDIGDSNFSYVEAGDLIVSGQFAWEGAVTMASHNENGCVVSHRYPVIRGNGLETEYLLALFMTNFGDFLLNESSRGSAGRNKPLNIGLLLNEKIRMPSQETQKEIKRLINLKSQAESKLQRSVRLLKERRAAFITAAVTGQIDLRGE